MSQFDIHRLSTSGSFVCRVQTDLGLETGYILCAPVLPTWYFRKAMPRLHIPFEVEGKPHLIMMSQLVALPEAQLGVVVGNADDHRDDIVRAVDLLVTGF